MLEELNMFKDEMKQATEDADRSRSDNDEVARADAKEADDNKAKAKAENRKKQDQQKGDELSGAFNNAKKIKEEMASITSKINAY